jgi:hypothetical protein
MVQSNKFVHFRCYLHLHEHGIEPLRKHNTIADLYTYAQCILVCECGWST